MKKIFVVMLAALAFVSCLKSDGVGVEGSKTYSYEGWLVTTQASDGAVVYDSSTEVTEVSSDSAPNFSACCCIWSPRVKPSMPSSKPG